MTRFVFHLRHTPTNAFSWGKCLKASIKWPSICCTHLSLPLKIHDLEIIQIFPFLYRLLRHFHRNPLERKTDSSFRFSALKSSQKTNAVAKSTFNLQFIFEFLPPHTRQPNDARCSKSGSDTIDYLRIDSHCVCFLASIFVFAAAAAFHIEIRSFVAIVCFSSVCNFARFQNVIRIQYIFFSSCLKKNRFF